MKRCKKVAVVLAAMIMLGAFTITANAETVETEEFGTIEYDLFLDESELASRGFSTVRAYTTMSNPGTGKVVMTTMDVEINSTGELIATRTDTDSSLAHVHYDNEDRITLAAFTCHEARNNESIARYLACIF